MSRTTTITTGTTGTTGITGTTGTTGTTERLTSLVASIAVARLTSLAASVAVALLLAHGVALLGLDVRTGGATQLASAATDTAAAPAARAAR